MTTQNDINNVYQKMEPIEHILELPDTYIGSVQEDENRMWVFNSKKNKMELKSIKYVPGLYKIYDEILVNARDHFVKHGTCSKIKIDIHDDGYISCYNNGEKGIPVLLHEKYQVYIPEFLFGQLLTSGNYKQKGKIVGGKNGYGGKLANIFASHFYIEVVDHKEKLKYSQSFYDNMSRKDEPIITKSKEKSYVLIKFKPDYERFGVKSLSDDMSSLFKKRAYDLAACTNIDVYLNDELIKINNFNEYIDMFYDDDNDIKPIYEQSNERWRIAVVFNPNSGFRQISYVNGICTFQGGSHVAHVTDQIITKLIKFIETKHKSLKIKNNQVKDNLTVFIDCVIEDPSFNSQTKEQLTTKLSLFGSRCEISNSFITQLTKTGIVDEVINLAKLRASSELKKSDGKKTSNLKLEKYAPAGKVGVSKHIKKLRLILTEGDSAKKFAIDGLEVIGNDYYGVFPLKGKLLNVREATTDQLLKNEEIKNIKQIMGLKNRKKYTEKNLFKLNYGGIIILTDRDVDGFHIKGLLMNFIHVFWPSLLKVDGFIQSINTPIIKAWKKNDKTKQKTLKSFISLPEYRQWKNEIGDDSIKKWNVKYFKGLGTHDAADAKEIFKDYNNLLVSYTWGPTDCTKQETIQESPAPDTSSRESTKSKKKEKETDEDEEDEYDRDNVCFDAITLAFAKTRVNDRKKWLLNYKDEDNIQDPHNKSISYYDFIHTDLIQYSKNNIIRSIPSVIDGFKPSQRKILFSAFKRGIIKNEIKVSQLSGFVSDKTCYHHGEQSLQEAIIVMARNFVGSNNINLLLPNGNFGTRRLGGEDAASPRYIYTQINPLTTYIFREEDECVLTQNNDDGILIEYINYAPIIPIVLINGAEGIGTGFSTASPCYNPKDVITNVKLYMNGKELNELTPWYNNFKGKIRKVNDETYVTHGKYKICDDVTVKITELPIGCWTDKYLIFLDSITIQDESEKTQESKKLLTDYKNVPGNDHVNITLKFIEGKLQELIKSRTLESKLKLTTNIKLTNMHFFDVHGNIKKYKTPNSILKEFCKYRLHVYKLRKEYRLRILTNELEIINWKIRFLNDYVKQKIIIYNIKEKKALRKDQVISQLVEFGYPKLSHSVESPKSYDYITTIPLFSLTQEESARLRNESLKKFSEYCDYKEMTVMEMWTRELNELEAAYEKYNHVVE